MAYGLSPESVKLDNSYQTNILCQIHTTYGDTDPFLINGVTRQGGLLSPFKSMLTTSLGHQWLTDSFGISVWSLKAIKGEPHTHLDALSFKVAMVEATDDSLLFSHLLSKLQRMCI